MTLVIFSTLGALSIETFPGTNMGLWVASKPLFFTIEDLQKGC